MSVPESKREPPGPVTNAGLRGCPRPVASAGPARARARIAGTGILGRAYRKSSCDSAARRQTKGYAAYATMHLSPAELDALRLSLAVAARSVLFSLPFAVIIAWLLTRGRFAGRWLLDAFVHLPLVLPPVAIGYVLLLLFGNHGPIGGWLHDNFGVQLAFTTAGAALATAVMAFPLMVRSIRLSLENVDPGLEAAARTLGAKSFDRFFTITLPLMLPGVVAGAVTAFAAGLGEFGAVITFAANLPGVTRTIPLALYTAIQSPGGDDQALRLAIMSFVLGLIGLLLAEMLARRARSLVGR
jgi:molybdate transport system permease protein